MCDNCQSNSFIYIDVPILHLVQRTSISAKFSHLCIFCNSIQNLSPNRASWLIESPAVDPDQINSDDQFTLTNQNGDHFLVRDPKSPTKKKDIACFPPSPASFSVSSQLNVTSLNPMNSFTCGLPHAHYDAHIHLDVDH